MYGCNGHFISEYHGKIVPIKILRVTLSKYINYLNYFTDKYSPNIITVFGIFSKTDVSTSCKE